jgi:hypothetical protein
LNFSDYIIDESDYDFFISLPADEKLLFIHDLICDNAYGIGSSEALNTDIIEKDVDKMQDIIEKFQLKLDSIIEASINEKALVNVLIINNKIILNSKSLNLIDDAILDLYTKGYLLSAVDLTEKQSDMFHRQRYCRVFDILGKLPPILQN